MTLLVVVGAMLGLIYGVGFVLAQESSRQLIPGASVTASLDRETFARTFWFDGTSGQSVTLFASTTADGLDLAMLLNDSTGNLLAVDSDFETVGAAAIANVTLPADGRFYVTVIRSTGAEGDASGEFTLTFAVEAGETPETPGPGQPVATAALLVTLDAGIQVPLSWNSTADLGLEVRDPQGNSVYWNNPTAGSGVFERNANGNCVATTDNAVERITFTPGALPVGSYEIIVYYLQGCDNTDPVSFSLNTVVDGKALEPVTGTLRLGQEFLSSFVVTASGEAANGASGISPGDRLADPTSFLGRPDVTPLTLDTTVTGRIDSQNPYRTYSFTGGTGDMVTIRMNALDGNLDTKLYLLDPAGIQVAFNDDALNANTTNSAIANQTLVSNGTYTIVATRYGTDVGGTEGNYDLTLTGADLEVPAALANLNLPVGSIEVGLLWNTNADLQLLVRDPSGNAVYDDIPVSETGGRLAEDGNVNCRNTTTSPVSYIYWPPDRLPPGTYEVEVWYQNDCGDTSPVTFNLTTRVNGDVIISSTQQPLRGQIYLTTFIVDVNGTATAGAGGFIGGADMFNLSTELANATPINFGDTVSGTINRSNRFDLYAFEGAAGDQIRIGMQATAGTLDPMLYLISGDGLELAANDDAVVNETTNALIDNFTLAADGTYVIIATHYGGVYGGTSGTYNLSIVRLN